MEGRRAAHIVGAGGRGERGVVRASASALPLCRSWRDGSRGEWWMCQDWPLLSKVCPAFLGRNVFVAFAPRRNNTRWRRISRNTVPAFETKGIAIASLEGKYSLFLTDLETVESLPDQPSSHPRRTPRQRSGESALPPPTIPSSIWAPCVADDVRPISRRSLLSKNYTA